MNKTADMLQNNLIIDYTYELLLKPQTPLDAIAF